KAEMQLTTLRNFSLGPFHFRKIPTYIFNDDYDVTSYPQLGGLIGNDLLRRFNLIVNYAHSEIYILPNSSYNQPFDYSYTGVYIGLFDGKIEVTDVILMINGDAKQDVQVYQNLLRTFGPKVKVLVRHPNGELALLEMKVSSIL